MRAIVSMETPLNSDHFLFVIFFSFLNSSSLSRYITGNILSIEQICATDTEICLFAQRITCAMWQICVLIFVSHGCIILTIPVGKLIYYSTHFVFCQERNKKMDDDIEVLRQAVMEAAKECTDPDMLDLVYKLLCNEAG